MPARWTPEEDKTLLDNVGEGVEVSVLEELLPIRSIHAITSKAKTALNYGVKTTDGIKIFQYSESVTRIVGEPEAAPTAQEPTILESTNQNLSNESIAESVLEQSSISFPLNDIFSANRKAIEFMIVNNLNANSEDIKYITDLIIRLKPA